MNARTNQFWRFPFSGPERANTKGTKETEEVTESEMLCDLLCFPSRPSCSLFSGLTYEASQLAGLVPKVDDARVQRLRRSLPQPPFLLGW